MINSEIVKITKKSGENSHNLFFARCLDYLPVFAVSLFALVCLCIGFAQKPQVYPVDYGQYEWILPDVGLTWTAESC